MSETRTFKVRLSEDRKRRWAEAARREDTPLSEFIIERVELAEQGTVDPEQLRHEIAQTRRAINAAAEVFREIANAGGNLSPETAKRIDAEIRELAEVRRHLTTCLHR